MFFFHGNYYLPSRNSSSFINDCAFLLRRGTTSEWRWNAGDSFLTSSSCQGLLRIFHTLRHWSMTMDFTFRLITLLITEYIRLIISFIFFFYSTISLVSCGHIIFSHFKPCDVYAKKMQTCNCSELLKTKSFWRLVEKRSSMFNHCTIFHILFAERLKSFDDLPNIFL